ncbi:MAG: hypothetical protein AAF466_00320 [Bacteroidota bacterium]
MNDIFNLHVVRFGVKIGFSMEAGQEARSSKHEARSPKTEVRSRSTYAKATVDEESWKSEAGSRK